MKSNLCTGPSSYAALLPILACVVSLPTHAADPEPAPQVMQLEYRSAFDDYRRWDEPSKTPSWRDANRAAAEAGGWQAYATDLYRANKAARDVEAADDKGADS